MNPLATSPADVIVIEAAPVTVHSASVSLSGNGIPAAKKTVGELPALVPSPFNGNARQDLQEQQPRA